MNIRWIIAGCFIIAFTFTLEAGTKEKKSTSIVKGERKISPETKKRIQQHIMNAQKALKEHKNRDAIAHYTKAARLGDTKSQCFLGSCYLYGLYGVSKDKEKAVQWYRKAAKRGNKLAQEQLSRCFADGTAGINKPKRASRKSAKWSKESHRL